MNRDIITEKVKQNKRYCNNEDLLESIVDLSLERLDGVVDSILDDSVVNRFVEKIVSKSVIDILKQENRYSLKPVNKLQMVDYKVFAGVGLNPAQDVLPVSKLKQIYVTLKKSDENNDSAFLDVLNLRYRDKKSLKEISKEMNLSEVEVADILFDMSGYSDKVVRI